MKLGCRAHDYGRFPAAELARRLQERGYHAAQVAAPKALTEVETYEDLTPERAAEIGAAFRARDVEITVLGCYMDLSAPDAETRRAGLENVKRCLRVQRAMGAKLVGSETSYDHLTPEEKRARLPLMTDTVLRIVEEAARTDGVFAIEPVFWHPLDSLEETEKLVTAVADPVHFRMIFDPANVLKRRRQGEQTALWKEWLGAFGERIAAMHIKDFVLEGDTYIPRPLGCGCMDFTYLRQWLQANRPDMPLLREEVQLHHDLADLDFMSGLVRQA